MVQRSSNKLNKILEIVRHTIPSEFPGEQAIPNAVELP